MTQKSPSKLYKYTTVDAALKILTTSTVRFSSPNCFNDPYDSRPPIYLKCDNKNTKQKLYNAGINIKEDSMVLNKKTTSISNFFTKQHKYYRIFCLSKTNKSILMWSHYANCHRGVVIEFNSNTPIIKEAEPIKYQKSMTIDFDILKDFPKLQNKKAQKTQEKLYLIKFTDWQYEQEYRCSFITEDSENFKKKFHSKDVNNKTWENCSKEFEKMKEHIHIPIPVNAIKAVYLGCNINPIDKTAIIEILKTKYPRAKCYEAKKFENSFELKFNEITLNP